MQQDALRNVSQQWLAATPNVTGAASDWYRTCQRQLLELNIDVLNAHRQSLDAAYKSAIEIFEKSSRISVATTPEEHRQAVDELWRHWFDALKTQSEGQLRDLRSWAAKSLEIVQSAQA
jgi:hypothetical protein